MTIENQGAPPAGSPGDTSVQTPGFDQEALSNLVNSAVNSQLKRMLPKVLEAALEPALAPIRERLPVAAPEKPAQGASDPVQSQIDELRKQLKREQDGRAQERRVAREATAFSTLRSELTGKVRPEAVDAAAKLLFHADRLVQVTESGEPIFKQGDDELPLREGLASWLKSKEAALFLPAPGYGQGNRNAPAGRKVAPPGHSGASQGNQPEESPAAKTQRMLAEKGLSI